MFCSTLSHRFIYIEVNDIEIVEDVISFNCVVGKPEYAYVVRKRQKKGRAIKHFKDWNQCTTYLHKTFLKLIIMMEIFGKVKTTRSNDNTSFFKS